MTPVQLIGAASVENHLNVSNNCPGTGSELLLGGKGGEGPDSTNCVMMVSPVVAKANRSSTVDSAGAHRKIVICEMTLCYKVFSDYSEKCLLAIVKSYTAGMKLAFLGLIIVAILSLAVAVGYIAVSYTPTSAGTANQAPNLNEITLPCPPPYPNCTSNQKVEVPFSVLLNSSAVYPTYSVTRGQNVTIVITVISSKSMPVSITASAQSTPVGAGSSVFVSSSAGIAITLPANNLNLNVGSTITLLHIQVGATAGVGIHPMQVAVVYPNGIGHSGFLAGFNLNVQG